MIEAKPSSDIAFTASVKAMQSRRGSREAYARVEARGGFQTGPCKKCRGAGGSRLDYTAERARRDRRLGRVLWQSRARYLLVTPVRRGPSALRENTSGACWEPYARYRTVMVPVIPMEKCTEQ